MSSKRSKQQTYGRIKRTDIIINEPHRYDCPEGHVHIYILGKRYRIPVLLDPGSNIFLINEQLVVTTLQIGSYSGLDSSPYGIPSGNHIEDRPVYLVYYR